MYLTLILAFSYLMLIGFLIYAATKHAWYELKFGMKVLIAPAIIVFACIDVLFNVIIGSLMFIELPTQLTFSERCIKHYKQNTWRGSIARAFSIPLNAIDKDHIK